MLSHFSRVQLCATLETAAHQAPIPGILQARTLEWVAISFSNAWKWKVKVKSLSRNRLFTTPWTAAYQAPPSMGFSRQKYWSGVPLPSPAFAYIHCYISVICSTSTFFFPLYFLPVFLLLGHVFESIHRWPNLICLIQSHLLLFLSEIGMSIEHSSGQKRPEGSLLMGTEVAWKGILWKERRYMRSQYCLSPDSFHAAHSM